EKTFLSATAQLLRKEGFLCDCAETAEQALGKFAQKPYALLIADIQMPGNSNLELVKKTAVDNPATSIILITGYPSQKTAIEAVGLPITAYILKPINFPEFMQQVKSAVKTSTLYRIISKTKGNLAKWAGELENVELSLGHNRGDVFGEALKSFLDVTTAKIDETFDNVRLVSGLLDEAKSTAEVCQIMQCPILLELTEGIRMAIESIKKSKEIYKSKQLAEIRAKLEKLIDNARKF
ncbi:MAG: response regulator, partial [Phycisphaerae bacterium]|nr:response regulator [Phycisphaerae bacterium]